MDRVSSLRCLAGAWRMLSFAVVVALGALVLPGVANAASSVYWSDGGSGAILVGGAEGGAPTPLIESQDFPSGIALDPASGKIYWATREGGEVKVANLDGSDEETLLSGLEDVEGIALDPASGKIYWAEELRGKIEVASIDGTEVETLYEPGGDPVEVVLDAATGKLYWAEYSGGRIMAGNLAGGEAEELFSGQSQPVDVAVNAAAGKIYWTEVGGQIMAGGLNGTGAETLFSEAEGSSAYPTGIALDTETDKLYWSDSYSGNVVFASLSEATGTTGGTPVYEGQNVPFFVALLSSPVGTEAPVVAGQARIGQSLSCSTGSWAEDEPEASFYRAPASFAYQWLQNGVAIAGATSSTFTTSEAGSYTCAVTASNAEGSATRTSVAVNVAQTPTPAPAPSPAPTPTPTLAPTPTPMPTPTLAKPAIIIKLVNKSVTHGKAKVTLECAGATCTGKLSLAWVHKRGGKRITTLFSHSPYTLAAGKSNVFVMRLSKEAIKRLRKGKLQVRARATVKGGTTAHRFAALMLK